MDVWYSKKNLDQLCLLKWLEVNKKYYNYKPTSNSSFSKVLIKMVIKANLCMLILFQYFTIIIFFQIQKRFLTN